MTVKPFDTQKAKAEIEQLLSEGKKAEADLAILIYTGMGTDGFQRQAAHTLFYGKGYYSGESVGAVNQRLAAAMLECSAKCEEDLIELARFYLDDEKLGNGIFIERNPQNAAAILQSCDSDDARRLLASLRGDTPLQRLAFYLDGADGDRMISLLKDAKWRISSESYCAAMLESLESGYPDDDALLWRELYSLREDVRELCKEYGIE